MIKGIIFDMDGLMFDTERITLKAWNDIGKRTGYDLTEKIIAETMRTNYEDTKSIFLKHFGAQFDYDAFRKMQNDYIREFIEENGIPAMPGLYALIDYLKTNDYRMTVATSSNRNTAVYYLHKAKLSNSFNEIVCGDMIEQGKPAPDIYLKAAEILNLAPSECLALEDSPTGILSASRAKVKPVMIPDLLRASEETRSLLFAECSSLEDVIELLKSER